MCRHFQWRQAIENVGTITLTSHQDGNHAIIEVIDTGCGIAKENLEKIFSPFFTTKANGNGFGLSEVHKIIQAHGGKIEVATTSKVGTTMKVSMPLKTLEMRP